MPPLHLRRHSKCITGSAIDGAFPRRIPATRPARVHSPWALAACSGLPAQAAPTIDPLALLGKLVTLQSAGQLTQPEYEQLKTALMHYGATPQQMHT